MLLNALEQDNLRFLANLQHRQRIGILAAELEDQAYRSNIDKANEALRTVTTSLFPWQKPVIAASAIESLKDAWIRTWGDPEDPITAAAIQRTVDLLNQR